MLKWSKLIKSFCSKYLSVEDRINNLSYLFFFLIEFSDVFFWDNEFFKFFVSKILKRYDIVFLSKLNIIFNFYYIYNKINININIGLKIIFYDNFA